MFSPNEEKVLKILKAVTKPMSISDVTEKFYKGQKKPLDPNAIVSGAVLNINKKCKYNKLNWIIKGEGLGRKGKVVWIESL